MKRVYWDYTLGDNPNVQFPDEIVQDPKKFRAGYSSKYDHAKCPAWKKWTENCWVVTQPFDIGMKCDTKNGKLATDLSQKAYDAYVHVGGNWLAGRYPEIQFRLSYMLWTNEKDVWVEQIPHPLLSRYGFELIPATFPISHWHRPLVVGMKILDTDQNLMLKAGTPLYYFRLYSKKSDPDFIIERKAPPEEWHKMNRQSALLREYLPFKSWEIIKQRLSNGGKCPIKWK